MKISLTGSETSYKIVLGGELSMVHCKNGSIYFSMVLRDLPWLWQAVPLTACMMK